jgi:hypothetical protein
MPLVICDYVVARSAFCAAADEASDRAQNALAMAIIQQYPGVPGTWARKLGIDVGAAPCYTVYVRDLQRSVELCGKLSALYP